MNAETTKEPIRITAVCGSLSARSATKMALSVALKGASEYDVSTKLTSADHVPLPTPYSPPATTGFGTPPDAGTTNSRLL